MINQIQLYEPCGVGGLDNCIVMSKAEKSERIGSAFLHKGLYVYGTCHQKSLACACSNLNLDLN